MIEKGVMRLESVGEKSTVLVAGSEGYIGTVLVDALTTSGHKVLELDAFWYSKPNRGDQMVQDVRGFSISELPILPDAVVYLAAVSNDPMGLHFEAATFSVNVDAAVELAREAKSLGVARFIFASSCSIYGHAGEARKTEADNLEPITAYAKSKVDAEKQLSALSDSNFQVTCLRFATACGSSPNLRLDLVLNDFVASAVQTGKISILSDGTPWRPLINVSDIARAAEWALTHSYGYESLAINVGSEEFTYDIRGLAEGVAALIPGTEVEISSEPARDSRSYKVDFTLFRRMAPDAQPLMGLQPTVFELAAQIKSIDLGVDDFRKQPSYIRLIALEEMVLAGGHDDLLLPLLD